MLQSTGSQDLATTHRRETRISLLCVKRLWLQPWYKRPRITPPHTTSCSQVWRRKILDPTLCWPKCGEVSRPPAHTWAQSCVTAAGQPRGFPGKDTAVDCHALLQGILPTQGLLTLKLLVLPRHQPPVRQQRRWRYVGYEAGLVRLESF